MHLDQDYLVLSENYVWEENGELVATGSGKTMIAVYPAVEKGIVDFKECGKRGNFTLYERIYKAQEPEAELVCKEQDKEKAVYELKLAYPGEKNYHDAFAFLTCYGNRMEVFDGEEKINDYFIPAQEAPLSLGYFEFPEKLKNSLSILCIRVIRFFWKSSRMQRMDVPAKLRSCTWRRYFDEQRKENEHEPEWIYLWRGL